MESSSVTKRLRINMGDYNGLCYLVEQASGEISEQASCRIGSLDYP